MIKFSKTTGGATYASPFIGPVNHQAALDIDLSGLTDDEVDAQGYLKPGVPFNKAGQLVTSGFVYGVSIEAIQVANGNTVDDLDGTARVAVAVIGVVSKDLIEDNLERALTAPEIAGFDAAGSKIVLHHHSSINT